jgi:hypothetical protein
MMSMVGPEDANLSGLAGLAQTRGPGLRSALLASQAALFAAAPRRDPVSIATFEALALGLIPLVGRATLAEVAALLEPVADVPRPVRAMLEARLGDTDLALAQDPTIVLDGHRLAGLVDAARSRADLAAALLARPEPSVFDRAVLYRVADRAQRRAIREDLAEKLPRRSVGRLALPSGLRTAVRAAPSGSDAARLLAAHGIGPTQEAAASGLASSEADQELFALALLAVGLAREECGRFFLSLDPAISQSAEAVFHLARVICATPPAVATWLADPDDRALAAEVAARRVPALDPSGSFVRPFQSVRNPDPMRGRAGAAPADHRSTATRDRNRT